MVRDGNHYKMCSSESMNSLIYNNKVQNKETIINTNILITYLIILSSFAVNASSINLFSNDIPNIVINKDINNLFEERNIGKGLRNKKLISTTLNGKMVDIEYKVIGNSRASLCQKPPLKVYFSENESYYLTTHCEPVRRTFGDEFEEKKVVREFFAYELFYRLNKYAFKAKLVKVKYGKDDTYHWGFLSESNSAFSARTQLREYNGNLIQSMDKTSHLIGVLLQRVIGNKDYSWSGTSPHNFKLYADLNGKTHPVFYDFDAAAIVNNGNPQRWLGDVKTLCQSVFPSDIQKAKEEIKKNIFLLNKLLEEEEIIKGFRYNFSSKIMDAFSRTTGPSIPYEIGECSITL